MPPLGVNAKALERAYRTNDAEMRAGVEQPSSNNAFRSIRGGSTGHVA